MEEVRPQVEKMYQDEVDKMIAMELENMRLLSGAKGGKKKKGKKKGKKGKKKKAKKIKLPGAPQAIKEFKDEKFMWNPEGYDPYLMLVELIRENIVKKLPP